MPIKNVKVGILIKGEKMSFDVELDDDLDLDVLTQDIVVPDANMYIADEDKAVELISELIKNKTDDSISFRKQMENKINHIFSLFSEVTIENEMLLYERFMELCSKLSARRKIQKLQNKVVVSFGGEVSAGKSKFINTISGIGDKLPVDQKTTTAIPTYIMKSETEKISANSVYGYSTDISVEALNAMAHEFDTVYGIGFSTFVDSIIVESPEYALPKEIALLDTPGYTKFDETTDSKKVISDREKAFEQLSISDYLIWLIDIDGGTVRENDIKFIESLKIKTPILIVFTKADKKSEKEIHEIIDQGKKTLENTKIDCFGITAYSSNLKKEFGGNTIEKFLNYTIEGNIRNNDIIEEFKHIQKDMEDSIKKAINQSRWTANTLYSYISNSDKIMEIRSLVKLWGKENQQGYILFNLLKQYQSMVNEMDKEIRKYFREGE